MLQQLEYLTDELTAATHKAQSLLTDYGFDCENAELDGLAAPALDDSDKKRLGRVLTSTREALKILTELTQ